ncbi:unnamed protein product [Gongylonema pulchrum]|uniref:Uncharacterized protein n=1 Tax=Gongylonema pulchrum TaxID=637853 RepID=A0A183DNG2_9BILA|nr:unnamed protein product [Gongylonema pulchrum]
MESIRAAHEALQTYRQTGWLPGSNSSSAPAATVDENVKLLAARRSPHKLVSEGASENQPTASTSPKPKLKASDVEPLKQLLNMRRQQPPA